MPREIGWSIESNLLYGIKTKLGCNCIPQEPATTSSTTTAVPTTSTTTTSAA